MQYHPGQTIIHPFHGPVTVTAVTTRTIHDQPRTYLQLEATDPILRISVPVDRADDIGLREVSSPQRVKELLGILGAPSAPAPGGWSRRIKEYQARAATGQLDELCYVIREITLAGPKPPASAEGIMLRDARRRVGEELAIALDVSPEEAEQVIHATVAEQAGTRSLSVAG